MDYRFKHDVVVFQLPEDPTEENRGDRSCCCEYLVLASTTDPDQAINDIKGVYHKKSQAGDVISFEMVDCSTGNVIANYGVVKNFPNDPLVEGFEYDWRQVLINEGPGTYDINMNYTISGLTSSVLKGRFTLKEYSISRAKGTVRFLSIFDSLYLFNGGEVDFTGSNFRDSIRFKGFYGKRQPGTQIKQLIDTGRESKKTTRENLNTYELKTDPVLECITKPLLEFFFLCEDQTFVTDHNFFNHTYKYFDWPVVIDEEPEVDYKEYSRYADITAVFADKKKFGKSMYNQPAQ